MLEDEADTNGRQSGARSRRLLPDRCTPANLVVPSYLTSEYAAKPSAARPFADICRPVSLPAEGMKVELAKGNTSGNRGFADLRIGRRHGASQFRRRPAGIVCPD